MKEDLLEILVANLVLGIILYIVQRWRKEMFFGSLGILIIVLPSMFAYFQGRLYLIETICACLGVLLIAADMREKLPGRTDFMRRVGFRDRD